MAAYEIGRRSFIKRQTSGTSSDNEWQRLVQRVVTNDSQWQRIITSSTTYGNEWDNEWQRVTTSDTTSDNEWQRMTTSCTTNENEFWVQNETKYSMYNYNIFRNVNYLQIGKLMTYIFNITFIVSTMQVFLHVFAISFVKIY